MEILYKAKDGTIFDSEWECEKYENTLECEELKDSLFWWNSKQKPIPVCENAEPLHYFYIKSDDALEFMEEVFSDYGWSAYDDLEVGGMYYWNGEAESFYNTAEQIDRLNDEIKELREIRCLMAKGAE